jgi:hypothetical protein
LDNSGGEGAGVSLIEGSTATLTSCTFSGNAGGQGGGMSVRSSSSAGLTKCTFNNNGSSFDGGAMTLDNASATLVNCSVTNNRSAQGGGIAAWNGAHLNADTTEFTGNKCRTVNMGDHGIVGNGSQLVLTCSVADLTGFVGDGTITLNNEGCYTPTKPTSWGRLKALYKD